MIDWVLLYYWYYCIIVLLVLLIVSFTYAQERSGTLMK